MRISEQQQVFARNVARLIEYTFDSKYACSFGEVYRTPEQSQYNASKGIGIKNSLHCKRLAVDLMLFFDGKYLIDTEAYRPFGVYWQSLHPANRWGGDWDKDGVADKGENDGNHFEMKEVV